MFNNLPGPGTFLFLGFVCAVLGWGIIEGLIAYSGSEDHSVLQLE
ncbi:MULTISPECIES: hypothetical protein [Providencia]|nr:hypothetical protein [Providencia sp. PROV254]